MTSYDKKPDHKKDDWRQSKRFLELAEKQPEDGEPDLARAVKKVAISPRKEK